MTPFKIREATKNDAESIDLLCIQLGYASDLNRTASSLELLLNDKSHCVFLAELNGENIAWIHAFIALRLESESFVEIGGLVVEHQHRKQGVAKMLIHTVQNWALSRNLNRLRVRCNTIRKETHDFYVRHGFRETKEQKVFDFKH